MHRMLRCALLILLSSTPLLCAADATNPTKDIAGAADPAWLKRFEGSYIVSHEARKYDAVAFPASRLLEVPDARDRHNNRVMSAKRTITAKGEYQRLVYVAPADVAPLEVIHNYIQEFKANGGKPIYGCTNIACGGEMNGRDHGGGTQGLIEKVYPQDRGNDEAFSNGACTNGDPREQRYFLGTVPDGNGGERTVGVIAYSLEAGTYCKALDGRTVVTVVAVTKRSAGNRMVTVTSDDMAKALAAEGRISLYGIYFDTNKSAVKPESKATLAQIAQLLEAQPKLALSVVGHTDNVGGDKYNLGLSQRRADAVVAALVEDYAIDGDRLQASGAGMGKPVAGNDDEAGRAKNRRVELVKR